MAVAEPDVAAAGAGGALASAGGKTEMAGALASLEAVEKREALGGEERDVEVPSAGAGACGVGGMLGPLEAPEAPKSEAVGAGDAAKSPDVPWEENSPCVPGDDGSWLWELAAGLLNVDVWEERPEPDLDAGAANRLEVEEAAPVAAPEVAVKDSDPALGAEDPSPAGELEKSPLPAPLAEKRDAPAVLDPKPRPEEAGCAAPRSSDPEAEPKRELPEVVEPKRPELDVAAPKVPAEAPRREVPTVEAAAPNREAPELGAGGVSLMAGAAPLKREEPEEALAWNGEAALVVALASALGGVVEVAGETAFVVPGAAARLASPGELLLASVEAAGTLPSLVGSGALPFAGAVEANGDLAKAAALNKLPDWAAWPKGEAPKGCPKRPVPCEGPKGDP